jgi:putative aldouronate transport system permease protein
MSKSTLKRTRGDILFDTANFTFLTILLILVIYPLYFIVIASISDPAQVNMGKVILIPKGVGFEGYATIFKNSEIWIGYRNSLYILALGVATQLIVILPFSYAISRKDFYGKTLFTIILIITMFFNGGIIPNFLVIRNLGLYNTYWAIVLPLIMSPYTILITRTFFHSSIPSGLHDAARIDGASDTYFFIKVVLPLSKTIIAINILFHGVFLWNDYFFAMIYLGDSNKFSLQLILREILIKNQVSIEMIGNPEDVTETMRVADLIKYGTIVVGALPLMILYPFLQKYFVRGVMLGSLKG